MALREIHGRNLFPSGLRYLRLKVNGALIMPGVVLANYHVTI